jgi:intracellular sulfur oxidation DsrE/DsrF family protein
MMTEIDRRSVMSGLVLAGAVAAGAQAAVTPIADLKKEADVACLYHCDFGDPARFAQMLTNIANHYSVYGGNPFDIQLAIATHGAGVKFFLETLDGTPWKDDTLPADIAGRVAALAKNGLRVYLCDITFERLKLDRNKARKAEFISFVPSGVAIVAALQAKGFGYLKVG